MTWRILVLMVLSCAVAWAGDGVYVWQRNWSDKVDAAVAAELQRGTHELFVLGGELEHEGGAAKWKGVGAPRKVLKHPRVTTVFRLPVKALVNPDKTAELVVARAGVVGVSRIQLDVDVPESKMVRYAELVEGIRRRWNPKLGPLQLGATFLPCHLGLKDLRRVLDAIEMPVIQLHGIDAPKCRDQNWGLMNRTTVFQALRRARELDSRFRMALPDYAYVLVFGAGGNFVRLFAEGFPDDYKLPRGAVCEIAAPDLDLLSEILREPQRLPVIWFRLPVSGVDRWCLERETIVRLERGERPVPAVEFSVVTGKRPGVLEIKARYRHQIPLHGVAAVIDWGAVEASGEFFPLNGCRVSGEAAHGRLPDEVSVVPHACGEEFPVAMVIATIPPEKISIKVQGEPK